MTVAISKKKWLPALRRVDDSATRVGVHYVGGRGTFADIGPNGVSPDPLGAALTYVYEGAGIALASTSIANLVSSMRKLGIPVEADLGALGATVAMGNLQTSRLPVKGARLLPIQSKVALRNGRAVIESTRDDTVDTLTDEALKARAIDEILENLTAIAEKHERIVLEMTGGLDSRVTLAAAMHLGLHDRLDFLTRGGAAHPDRIIAERVAHAFDIDMIVSPYAEDFVSEEQFRGNAEFCAGVRWLDDVAFRMRNRRDGFVVITGAMGELWRNYYCEVQYYKKGRRNDFFSQPMTEEVAREMFSSFGGRRHFLCDQSAAEDAFVAEVCAHQETVGACLFEHYVRFRNRIHYGGAAAARAPYFASADPLYSVSAYELARRKDAEWQLFGELSFEIIDALFPALNAFPLAEKEVAPIFSSAARERRFIHGRKPMHGLKGRAGIRSVDRFLLPREKANDIAADFTASHLHLLDGFLTPAILDLMKNTGDLKKRSALSRAVSSAAVFMGILDEGL